MVRRALRVVLLASRFLVLLVLWTMARPALAYASTAPSAPLCDDRGATALAPPPALEAPDVAVQRARATTSCAADPELIFFAVVTSAHHGAAPPSAEAAPALPSSSRLRLAPLLGAPLDEIADAGRPLAGVRSRLDRPPRA